MAICCVPRESVASSVAMPGELSAARVRLYRRFGLRPVAGLGGAAVYRARSLADADVADRAALRALGIRTIIDLRADDERARSPYRPEALTALDVVSRPLRFRPQDGNAPDARADDAVAAYGAPGERMTRLYRDLATRRDALIAAVRTLERSPRPVVVHCVNGKDRAGVVCALAQLRAGVDSDAVRADYLAANDANRLMNEADLAAEAPRRSPRELAVLQAMFEARPAYLDAFLDAFGPWDF